LAKKVNEILIGADPELFAYDPGNVPVSVHNLLPGTKWNPVEVPRGAIQVDGVAAEFNIKPAANRMDFMRNIKSVRGLLTKVLQSNAPELELRATPCAHFPTDYFDSLPEVVKLLGCEPDYNAYTRKVNEKPVTTKPMRTGAGHIHVGWESEDDLLEQPEHFDTCCDLVQELDFTLYHNSKKWDHDEERRELYGAMGAFRPKKYGLEYRVLSNAWLGNPMIQMYVFDTTKAVSSLFFKGVSVIAAYRKKYGKSSIDNKDEYNSVLSSLHVPVFESYTT